MILHLRPLQNEFALFAPFALAGPRSKTGYTRFLTPPFEGPLFSSHPSYSGDFSDSRDVVDRGIGFEAWLLRAGEWYCRKREGQWEALTVRSYGNSGLWTPQSYGPIVCDLLGARANRPDRYVKIVLDPVSAPTLTAIFRAVISLSFKRSSPF